MKIAIINGPNLNLTGKREPAHYGTTSFEELMASLKREFPGCELSYYQSNIEGELVNRIHEAGKNGEAVILNAGAYTHTSLALADALGAVEVRAVEVHLSNIFAREPYRHVSYVGARCVGSISGLGMEGYRLALIYLLGSGKK